MTDYTEIALLNAFFGKTPVNFGALASRPTLYVALFTATPGEAGGGTEVSGNAYARVTTATSDWNAAASGLVDNANAITFPQATGAWGTVTHFGLFDAATVGNLLWYGTLGTSRSPLNGDTPKFNAGELDFTLN